MILFRYILKEFFKYAFYVLILCIVLFIVFDFIPRSTRYFSRYQASASAIALYYLYHSSVLLGQILPVSSLISSIMTMVIMNRSNEITVMRAVGLGPVHIAIPILCGGFILSSIAFINGEYITPVCMKKNKYLEEVIIEKRPPQTQFTVSQWFTDKDNVFYNFEGYDSIKSQMKIIKIIYLNQYFKLSKIIEASSGVYDKEQDSWVLENALISHFNKKAELESKEVLSSFYVKIPTDPEKLEKNRASVEEFSARELDGIIKQRKKYGLDFLKYHVAYHSKIAFYFASLLISLIGLSFAFKSERSVGLASGILFAIVLGMFYWFSLTFSSMLGTQHIFPVMLSSWLPNIFIVTVMVFLLRNIKES